MPSPDSPEAGLGAGDPGESDPGEDDAGAGVADGPACAAFGSNVTVGTGRGVGTGVIVGGDVIGGSVYSSSMKLHLNPT